MQEEKLKLTLEMDAILISYPLLLSILKSEKSSDAQKKSALNTLEHLLNSLNNKNQFYAKSSSNR